MHISPLWGAIFSAHQHSWRISPRWSGHRRGNAHAFTEAIFGHTLQVAFQRLIQPIHALVAVGLALAQRTMDRQPLQNPQPGCASTSRPNPAIKCASPNPSVEPRNHSCPGHLYRPTRATQVALHAFFWRPNRSGPTLLSQFQRFQEISRPWTQPCPAMTQHLSVEAERSRPPTP